MLYYRYLLTAADNKGIIVIIELIMRKAVIYCRIQNFMRNYYIKLIL